MYSYNIIMIENVGKVQTEEQRLLLKMKYKLKALKTLRKEGSSVIRRAKQAPH